MDKTTIWLVVGFMGQMFFSARFFLQWVYSEIKKKYDSCGFLVFFFAWRGHLIGLRNI